MIRARARARASAQRKCTHPESVLACIAEVRRTLTFTFYKRDLCRLVLALPQRTLPETAHVDTCKSQAYEEHQAAMLEATRLMRSSEAHSVRSRSRSAHNEEDRTRQTSAKRNLPALPGTLRHLFCPGPRAISQFSLLPCGFIARPPSASARALLSMNISMAEHHIAGALRHGTKMAAIA